VAAGVTDIGENYAQDLEAKAAVVPAVRWHFVGRLQRNKAAVLVRVGALVHSLDSLAGARALGFPIGEGLGMGRFWTAARRGGGGGGRAAGTAGR